MVRVCVRVGRTREGSAMKLPEDVQGIQMVGEAQRACVCDQCGGSTEGLGCK